MTTAVKIHVNGSYRATVLQDAKAPVNVEGNYPGSPNPTGEHTFWLPRLANSKFEVTEEYIGDHP
jgi:hypothetical protein